MGGRKPRLSPGNKQLFKCKQYTEHIYVNDIFVEDSHITSRKRNPTCKSTDKPLY